MAFKVIVLFSAVLAINLTSVLGHGRVTDPPHRGWAFRAGFGTPENWTDMENFCGGVQKQYEENHGKCGPCGDNYADPQPRANENGGKYGTGTIVKTYKAGSTIEVNVQLTASHKGYFEFSLCPLKNKKDVETEECFDSHKLKLAKNGDTKFTAIGASGDYKIKLVLPSGFDCQHCVFRWHYRTGNSAGTCKDGSNGLGCGNQEIFRACSDIKIL